MYTLFDFITQVKAVEYIIAVAAIAGFIILWELLKPRPFRAVLEHGREDIEHIRKSGYGNALKTAGMVVAAPFIGLIYIVALPFAFLFALVMAAVNGLVRATGMSASFGWRPLEAYLTGRKKKEGRKGAEKDEQKKALKD